MLALYRQHIDARLADVAGLRKSAELHCCSAAASRSELGELTPTLKLRRAVIQQHFADEIEQMYAE